MTIDTHRLLIGSAGWQHPEWENSYYPEDLPPDWRLGYYANEFSLAVITRREQALSDDLVAEIEECREQLMAVIAVSLDDEDAVQALQRAVALADQLGRQCVGVIVQCRPALLADENLSASLRGYAQQIPLCIDPQVEALSPALQARLRQQDIGWSWNAVSDSDGLDSGRLGIISIQGEFSPMQLRKRVETALKFGTDDRKLALVFHGRPPSIEQMRQAKMIEELL